MQQTDLAVIKHPAVTQSGAPIDVDVPTVVTYDERVTDAVQDVCRSQRRLGTAVIEIEQEQQQYHFVLTHAACLM